MGGTCHLGPQLPAEFDDRNCQCRALGRVGTGAQLVKQYQASIIALLGNLHNVLHMRGERGQGLLNALLVANVRKYRLKGGNAAVVRHRNMQAALRHQGK